MWRRIAPLLLLPAIAAAGEHDFYRCTDAGGNSSYSVSPCRAGQVEVRTAADALPAIDDWQYTVAGMVRLQRTRNHFFAVIKVNGVPIRAMVDTGASLVAISPSAAKRIKLDPDSGRTASFHTANGTASGVVLPVRSVELGGNKFHNIMASINGTELGPGIDALLGMSYLRHFEINMTEQTMTLWPR